MNVIVDDKIIDRILNKAIDEILPSKDELEKLLRSGKRIRVYQGYDPTAPTLHIGHSVMIRKLEDFRKLGHEVIFLIGNFTATIGDPSDKSATRKQLTNEQVAENLKLYKQQASALLDIDNADNPVKVMYNYDWLSKLTFEDVVKLSSEFTVQQMMKRSMFQKRLEEDKPIGLHEFLYPLMQGYDSVAMDVDVEVGGNDQLFNMLAGRTLMKSLKNKEKFVIAGKLLTTSDGRKMGKSEGNMIMLSDTSNDIYGKVMGFTDDAIVNGFELLTSLELDEVKAIEIQLEHGTNPMELKKKLAYEVTKDLKGEKEASEAQQYFESVFQKKDFQTDLQEISINNRSMITILLEEKITKSRGEVRRLVEQKAVRHDSDIVSDSNTVPTPGILKVGRRAYRLI